MSDRFVHFLLFRLAGVRQLIRQRVTIAGKWLLAGVVVSAVLGVDTQRNRAYQLFAGLLVVGLLAWVGLWRARRAPPCAVRRSLPRLGTVGQPLRYRLWLEGAPLRERPVVDYAEVLSDPRPDLARFCAARRPGEDRGARWQRLCREATRFRMSSVAVPVAGAEWEVSLEISPLRRGRLHLTGIRVSWTDALGLFKGGRILPGTDSALILPRRYRLPALDLPGHHVVQQGAQALASSVADAEEFQSLRDYRPGDPLRLIHWKSWARSGKPVIREYQDEFALRHALVLDTFGEGVPEPIFEEAVSLAASFACTVETRESLLDLLFVGAEVVCETAGRGHGPVERLLEVLAGVGVCAGQTIAPLQHAVMARRGELSGVICILLAWDAPRAAFIRALAATGLPHQVFVISDPARANLPALTAKGWPAAVRLLEAGRMEESLAAR
jgi:uncharacterized protein (DUF58 family)